MMIISQHTIQCPEPGKAVLVPSPNIRAQPLDPRFLVIHYTASSSLDGAVSWLSNPASGCSAHLVIGRDGSIVQLVSFDMVALHAGRSRWRGVEGLNRCSIGIELVNAGRMERKGGKWQAWFGKQYPDGDVMEAPHRNASRVCGWHVYTERQIETVSVVARLLVDAYSLEDVVGHDDIAPFRKEDPGPAFPMAAIRGRALGRAANTFEHFKTTTALNIRSGPGITNPTVQLDPLPRGTVLRLVSAANEWCSVEVIGTDGQPQQVGWVHGAYIRRAA